MKPHLRTRILTALLALTLACLSAPLLAARVTWHLQLEKAQAAAVKSGKPVYVFIYAPPLNACSRMRSESLESPEVKALLTHFECCALDSWEEANRPVVEKYAWAVSTDPSSKTRFGSMPAHLFCDAQGKEYYLTWGFIPATGFVELLNRVIELVRLKGVLAATPEDARATADLGHVLMVLELYGPAREQLQRAVDLDPVNQAGAKQEAALDLLILTVPDDPGRAYGALEQYLKDYPKTARALEARYYQAVALAAQRTPAKYREALKLLAPFKTATRGQPEYDSPWTLRAVELDWQLRQILGIK